MHVKKSARRIGAQNGNRNDEHDQVRLCWIDAAGGLNADTHTSVGRSETDTSGGLNADTHTSVGRSETDTSRNRLSWEKEHHANHLAQSNAHKEGTTDGRNPAPRKSLAFHTPGPCASAGGARSR